jgi:hypothetical protein
VFCLFNASCLSDTFNFSIKGVADSKRHGCSTLSNTADFLRALKEAIPSENDLNLGMGTLCDYVRYTRYTTAYHSNMIDNA